MSLFQKVALYTDIHFGGNIDSEIHNQDCLQFIEWFTEQTINNNCDTVIFLGDHFHNRIRTENRTGEYSRRGISILNSIGIPVFLILGNHDIYYNNNRDIHSLPNYNQYNNIHLIEKITKIDDVIFSPWLINDEYFNLVHMEGQYIFAHLELPLFLQNQSFVKRYEGKGIHADMFDNCQAVYSGHYHKRQVKINKHNIPIHYIGNCFPHDFNDLHDNDRGMAILEYGETQPSFIKWNDAPSYSRITASALCESLEKGISYHKKSVIEMTDDLDLSSDDINDIRNIINIRKLKINKLSKQVNEVNLVTPTQYNSLDDMITDQLKKLNYGGNYDPEILIDLYMSV